MILAFSKPQFMQRIIAGTKLFTLRIDASKRWKPGMKQHLWMHSPRTIKHHPDAHQFATGVCSDVVDVVLMIDEGFNLQFPTGGPPMVLIQYPNGSIETDIESFAVADGFADRADFVNHWGHGSWNLRQIWISDLRY